jgi:cytochrome c biogenesis factor
VTAVLTDHFALMVLLATLYSAFLSLLWRDDARERKRFFVRVFTALVGGAIAVAWLMYLLP